MTLRTALILALLTSVTTVGCGDDEPTTEASAKKKPPKIKRKHSKRGTDKDDKGAEAKAANHDNAANKDEAAKKAESDDKDAKPKPAGTAAAADETGKGAAAANVGGEPAAAATADLTTKAGVGTEAGAAAAAGATPDQPANAAAPAPRRAPDDAPEEAAAAAEVVPEAPPTDEPPAPAAAAKAAPPSARPTPVPAAPPTAAAPQASGGASAPEPPPLDVTGYLSRTDLERVVPKSLKKHELRRASLPGVKPSPTYNALYYAPGKGDDFGVSVQVWRDRNLVDSRTRFNTMRATWTNVVKTNKISEQGFRSHFGDVVTLVFADSRRPLVAAVSCDVAMCKADELIELATRVKTRLR